MGCHFATGIRYSPEKQTSLLAGDLFLVEKVAAENLQDSHCGHPVWSNQKAGEILPVGRIAAIEKIGPTSAGDLLEGGAVFLQGQKLLWRRSVRLAALVRGQNVDQPLRLAERQRAQERGVQQSEDGHVGANTESEGEDGDGGEARRLSQHAEPLAKVLPGGFEEMSTAGSAAGFFGLLEAAEC
jgi:hypothetical protein